MARGRRPNIDVLLNRHRDPHPADVEQQLRHGTCTSLDARLRTLTIHEPKDASLEWNSSTKSMVLKEQKSKRIVHTLSEILEGMLEEMKLLVEPALLQDRIAFCQLVSGYAHKYGETMAVQYARSIVLIRLRGTSKESRLCERMISPVDHDAVFAAKEANPRQRQPAAHSSSTRSTPAKSSSSSSSSSSHQYPMFMHGVCRDWNRAQGCKKGAACSYKHWCGVCGAKGKAWKHAGTCTPASEEAKAAAATPKSEES